MRIAKTAAASPARRVAIRKAQRKSRPRHTPLKRPAEPVWHSFEDVMQEFGLTDADLDAAEILEIE